jgi:hypothetical protein
MANAAWLVLAVMAHSLGRAVGRLAGNDLAKATASTLQRVIFAVPPDGWSPADADDTYGSPPQQAPR